ncbi:MULTISPECIES: O-antigen ligase family protein [unclassified Sphingomonas]|uniref:O-antigen ligase family protein n=1 Tax=unclassified Sphingomonas TaxID=196159 RepID=UPI000E74EBAC|nr:MULTISPECIES: O-antigen ligase family protein [unclassified Sphingomonas]RKE43618.1 O-antigen ligase [Sphingomonas sp. PP-CC-1A-547]TCM05842.1 O-antigen ligase [Sphingomonas sp. PP-CC-3G-468]
MTHINFVSSRSGRRIGKSLLTFVLGGVLALALTKPLFVMTGIFPHDAVSFSRQLAYAALTVLALVGAFLYKGSHRIEAVAAPILVVIAWFTITITWSSAIQISAQKLILTSIVTWLCFLVSDRLSNDRIIRTIRTFLLVILILNLLSVALYPTIGIHGFLVPGPHQWRGIMSHKNIAGTTTAVTILFFAFYGKQSMVVFRYAVVVVALVFLYYTQSRTALVALAIAFGAGLSFYMHSANNSSGSTVIYYAKIRKISMVGLSVIFAIIVVLTLNINLLIASTSNPEFLSGRSQIWQPMLIAYGNNPVFGTGYGAFWGHLAEASSRITREDGNFFTGTTQGHNGYLDIAVQTGLIGLMLAISAVVIWPATMLAKCISINRDLCALSMSIIVLYIVNNATESSMFETDQVINIFAMIVLGMLHKCVRRHLDFTSVKPRKGVRKRKTSPAISSLL